MVVFISKGIKIGKKLFYYELGGEVIFRVWFLCVYKLLLGFSVYSC